MCWYNSFRFICCVVIGGMLSGVWSGCQPSSEPVDNGAKVYFDLKGFFKQESNRLSESDSVVRKRVWKNGTEEEKVRSDIDWAEELALFSDSDINKPSWTNSYLRKENGDSLVYISQDSTLKTQRIEILGPEDAPRKIYIINKVSNPLYTSETQLTYFPDSLYRIEKTQTVRFLGPNQYKIEGFLKE